jgi:hypothetical protein
VLIGTLLGDGCLERNGPNVRLRVDHSITQEALVLWKQQILEELDPSRTRIVRRKHYRTGKEQANLRFVTATAATLNPYFELFYGEGEKGVPAAIDTLLTSRLSLAVWYMDDGGKRSDCIGGYLNTNAFSVDDVQRLRESLSNNFAVETALHFAASRPRIYIPSRAFAGFCDQVRDWVIPEMTYKLL